MGQETRSPHIPPRRGIGIMAYKNRDARRKACVSILQNDSLSPPGPCICQNKSQNNYRYYSKGYGNIVYIAETVHGDQYCDSSTCRRHYYSQPSAVIVRPLLLACRVVSCNEPVAPTGSDQHRQQRKHTRQNDIDSHDYFLSGLAMDSRMEVSAITFFIL